MERVLPGKSEVLIFGASGYAGLELLRLLAGHPTVRVLGASASSWAGEKVSGRVPAWPTELVFEPHEVILARAAGGHFALLATPAKTSAELAPVLLSRGVSVVDLSGAFRLTDPAVFAEWYGFVHPAPELLPCAEYGLPELALPPAPLPGGPRLVANPGCYATAAILATAPLLRAGLVAPGSPLVLDGKSGATGAGRTLEERLLFSEVAESVRPYRVGKHQHTPEIERALALVAGREVRVCFTAHLMPMRRGLLVSAYAQARPGLDPAELLDAFRRAYPAGGFVRVVEDRPPETGVLTGTNHAEVGVSLDPRTGTVITFAALDNLVKGAAGQALQNLSILLGAPAPGTLFGGTG